MNKNNSNIVSERGYRVQICDGVSVLASKVFANKSEAIASAKRIVKQQNSLDFDTPTYAMIWSGKQMIEYIDC